MTIGIRATSPEILDEIDPYLPPRWTKSPSPEVDRLYSFVVGGSDPDTRIRRFHVAYANFSRLSRSMDPVEGLQSMGADLSVWVAILAPDQVFLHAGVVAWKGRALVLPGRTYAGKSTLVAALIEAGATYYSDEWAVLDAKGRVHPYARPLSIRHGSKDGQPTIVPVEKLGGRAGTRPLPVGLVVETRFGGKRGWKPRQLTPAEGTLAMLQYAVQTHRDPALVLGTLRQVVASAPVLTGPRGEAGRVAPALLARLEKTVTHGRSS